MIARTFCAARAVDRRLFRQLVQKIDGPQLIYAQDVDVHDQEGGKKKKKGQIAIEPNFTPGLFQPTMGRRCIRRLKSA
jgi:hypothetical protein